MEDASHLDDQIVKHILANAKLSTAEKGEELLNTGIELMEEFRASSQIFTLHSAVNALNHSFEIYPASGTRVRNNLAIALNKRFEELGDLKDLQRSIELHEDALTFFGYGDTLDTGENTRPGYVDKGSTLNHIANRLSKRFEMFGQADDLTTAIKLDEEALLLHPPGHKRRAHSLDYLATKLAQRFEVSRNKEDLTTAIDLHQQALALEPPGDGGRLVTLNQLGNAFRQRFEAFGNNEDLDSSVETLKEAFSLTPQSNRIAVLNNLAGSLMRRFEKFGSDKDSKESIALLEEGLRSLPFVHPYRMPFLNNLAGALTLRFDAFSGKEDLDKAIIFYEEALHSQPEGYKNRATSLRDLANRFTKRFKHFGNISDMDAAIKCDEEALALSFNSTNRASVLNDLAEKISIRYQATGNIEDLNTAIAIHKEALSLHPPEYPGRSSVLYNLGCEFALRFETLGQVQDLNTAVSTMQGALALQPEGHKSRGRTLSILGRVLMLRFELLGYEEDLKNAVRNNLKALALHPPGHNDRAASLTNLANSLITRYELFGKDTDLNAAIKFNEEALSLQPTGHKDRKISATNLATCFSQRFQKHNSVPDLEAAIALHEELMQLETAGHRYSIYNYATLLSTKFNKLGNSDDLNRAISLYQEAERTVFKDSTYKAQCMFQLGKALIYRFDHLETKDDIDDIIHLLEEVSSMTTQFAIAFRSAQSWALFAQKYNHPSATKAFRTAVDILPQLIPVSFTVSTRTKNLENVKPGFAMDAAAHFIHTLHSCSEALEVLEAGRSIFWAQALQTSPDMISLLSVIPALGNQLQQYSTELSKVTTGQGEFISQSSTRTSPSRGDVSQLKKLQDKWIQTLEEIRGHSGFEDFLKPLNITRLKSATSQGIIVVLNITSTNCDALIMTPQTDGVTHLVIPEVNLYAVRAMAELLRHLVGSGNRDLSNLKTKVNADDRGGVITLQTPGGPDRYGKPSVVVNQDKSAESEFTRAQMFAGVLKWLWDNITSHVIKALDLKKASHPPRLWWCPTGPLAFLPLHAAGLYGGGGLVPEELVSDYVISSYTSTVSALVPQMGVESEHSNEDFKLVGVADTKSLWKTEEEIRNIQQYIHPNYMVELGTTSNPPATIEGVSTHMETASVVHFACHGMQSLEDPLESGLKLGDGKHLSISKIMQLSIPNASLAFLSACETAVGDEGLPDETLHIGASLIHAGFKSVVATMWNIQDEDGPVIADIFYKHLFDHVDFTSHPVKGFDPTKSAEALHYAVKELQALGIPPYRWVPFIHIGK